MRSFFIGLLNQVLRRHIYLIGDTHFDHHNIIRFCHRPFRNVQEMNKKLIRNWNYAVKDVDTVYFLGDLAYGRNSRPSGYWLKRLNGKIVFIKGSHDRGISRKAVWHERLLYKGHGFVMVHDPNPKKISVRRGEWVIHGHMHNNHMKNYPFINGARKTINVSAELINYRPISMDFLVSLDLGGIKRMDTINSKPERW